MPKLSAVIPDDVAALLKERAKAEDRSVGAVMRIAIAEHVGHVPGEVPAASGSPPSHVGHVPGEKDDGDQ